MYIYIYIYININVYVSAYVCVCICAYVYVSRVWLRQAFVGRSPVRMTRPGGFRMCRHGRVYYIGLRV